MDYFILKKLKILYNKYKNIEQKLTINTSSNDIENIKYLSTEYAKLSHIITLFSKWKKLKIELENNTLLLQDKEMHDIALEDINNIHIVKNDIENQIKILVLPQLHNKKDNRNCFLEIRSGSGGKESAIFVSEISRMYIRYAESKKWKIDIIHIHYCEYGGYKEIILKIIGKNVYGKLKFESGGHRVQRVPETESQGRIHTSTCIIAVMPELLKKEMPVINPQDLKIDTFRSSGAGGQHVNTTDSAIRITHLPTGIVVECQDERSQHKNKAKALSVLASRINAIKIAKQNKNKAHKKKMLLGTGERSDRIRTYNFIQKRVTDHRINLTIYKLSEIMNGKLDILINPIIKKYYDNITQSI
ncbi:peptide chain release factor 1 [Enterobacteriaceae endosymbiont of Neohaemonia nigricornis]|uniref:peptide chain release factor 1 n=1 Tax=Enterobacteriaceae endosymbiont of Neohaemonia nigricornis TaxID=2675792 RepID=UPI0014494ED1|nr:peptide chain release factor 1 [Enterobacteriaceae endosymbiont of Neohaemonia nigricornis]QJC30303.1 peptide chain release factor 1 [Enterobacteriaceae endosymbiont of Neohaemonia nigricornis]